VRASVFGNHRENLRSTIVSEIAVFERSRKGTLLEQSRTAPVANARGDGGGRGPGQVGVTTPAVVKRAKVADNVAERRPGGFP
jgi:hypothetical protein